MIYLLSNWIMFFPIACALAVVLAMTGDVLDRPRADFVRTIVRILIWQLLALAFIGVVFRMTPLHIIWLFVVLAFGIQTFFWERVLARNTLMLVVLATEGLPRRLEGVTHYLINEGRGIWRRIGFRLRRSLRTSGDWMVAIEQARLARDARTLQALNIFRQYGKRDQLRSELTQAAEQRSLTSALLGRIVVGSLSFIFLGLVSLYFILPNGLMALLAEFGMESSGTAFSRWQNSSNYWWPEIWLPVLIWSLIAVLTLIKLFPFLTRYPPLEWFFDGYYGALSLKGLAEIVTVEPQLSVACRSAAAASPVPVWSQRLTSAAQRIEAGEAVPTALQRARVLKRREASALALANTSESLSWAIDEIAESATRRLWDRTSITVQIAVVALVLVSASLVCVLVQALFGILTEWITSFAKPS